LCERAEVLFQTGDGSDAIHDCDLAAGVAHDEADRLPLVLQMLAEEAWARSKAGWQLCRLGGPDSEVVQRMHEALATSEMVRTPGAIQPDVWMSECWMHLHAGVHLRRQRKVRETFRSNQAAVGLLGLVKGVDPHFPGFEGMKAQFNEKGWRGKLMNWSFKLVGDDEPGR
jgi:hypothetical protein